MQNAQAHLRLTLAEVWLQHYDVATGVQKYCERGGFVIDSLDDLCYFVADCQLVARDAVITQHKSRLVST